MPVEIRELQITVSVQDSGGGNASSPAPASGGSSSSNDDVIAKCVEQVLEILKEKMER